MNTAIIHAGKAAPELKRLLQTLDSVGIRENYFMEDLVSTLRYEVDFTVDLNAMLGDILYGQYYQYQISQGPDDAQHKEFAKRILDDVSVLSARVAKHLHETLVTQGRYDTNGKFPYEFHSFDGRLIYLRSL